MLKICSFCKTGLLCVISTPATQDSGGYGFRHGRLWDLIVHLICIGQPFSPHVLSNASVHSIQYCQSFKNLNPASRFREAKLLKLCKCPKSGHQMRQCNSGLGALASSSSHERDQLTETVASDSINHATAKSGFCRDCL